SQFRSSFAQSLDLWHLSIDFATLPALNSDFIEEDPPIDLLMSAAASYAIGMIDGNSSLMEASHDVVRYQTWRGGAHLDTYRKVTRKSADGTLPKALNVAAFLDMLLILEYYEPRLDLSAEGTEILMPDEGKLRMPPGSEFSDQST
ncbi:MAG TPA: hypothetical protein EYN92_08835, partial [Dehalococcoidia bacterium]|nr:hypothetical protein [Dehalococcoidia bacterium]